MQEGPIDKTAGGSRHDDQPAKILPAARAPCETEIKSKKRFLDLPVKERIFTIDEAALYLRVGRRTIARYLQTRVLAHFRLGRSIRIQGSAIQHLLKRNRLPSLHEFEMRDP